MNYRGATESLLRAIEFGVDSEVLRFNLALANLGLADTTSAVRNLKTSLEMNPELRQAQLLLEHIKEKAEGS
jgi:hypothetical protein